MDAVNLQDCVTNVIRWKQEGLSTEQITQRLLQAGIPEEQAIQSINEHKRIVHEKKRNAAFVYCGIGIFLLSTGFLFTVLLFNSSGDFKMALYGLSLVGIALVFKGMIDLMS